MSGETVRIGGAAVRPLAWAKTNARECRPPLALPDPAFRWCSLAVHSADVAGAFDAYLQPGIARRLETLAERPLSAVDWDRLRCLTFLHDALKACKGFTDRIHPDAPGHAPSPDHVSPMLGIAGRVLNGDVLHETDHRVLDATGIVALAHWLPDDDDAFADIVTADALAAVFGHHGGAWDTPVNLAHRQIAADQLARTRFGTDPLTEMARLRDLSHELFPRARAAQAEPLPGVPAFWHMFAGLVMLADKTASDTRRCPLHPLDEPGPDARDRYARTRATVRRELDAIGFGGAVPRDTADPAQVLRPEHRAAPRPAQDAVLAAPLDAHLLLLEEQTGRGKTEAAVRRFVQLAGAGEVDALYFAVPTRSAAIELHARVAAALGRVWAAAGGDPPPVRRAVPGMSADTGEATRADDAPEPPWASDDSRMYLTAGIAVGTVDQALLAALRARDAWLRGAALSRSLLVVDEVHASDSYMTEILRRLVRQHIAAGGHVLLMSATVGSALVDRLLDAQPRGMADAVGLPYPLLRHGDPATGLTAHPFGEARTQPSRRISPTTLTSADAAVDAAIAWADAGARVLVIRAVVAEAVAFAEAVEARGGPLLAAETEAGAVGVAHHARFAQPDRTTLDRALEACFAADAPAHAGGVIAVCTQTAEQSLDIDADILITDPAPADVLIQRLGRLHRHARVRPEGFHTPWVAVIDPGDLSAYLDPNTGEPTGPPSFAHVYRNLNAVAATLDRVASGEPIALPDEARTLVERATNPEALDTMSATLGQPLRKNFEQRYGEAAADRKLADQRVLDWHQRLHAQPRLGRDEAQTRLGEDRVRVVLTAGFRSALGNTVTEIAVPHRWLGGRTPEPGQPFAATPHARGDGTVALHLPDGSVLGIYDRFGLHRADSSADV